MRKFSETDINRFVEAQNIPYFCGYRQALEEVKKLYAIVMANPLANMYLQSELAFSQLINDIGAILGEVINSVQK